MRYNAHIVLSRDKTAVREATADEDTDSIVELKSNRTAFRLSNTDVSVDLTVRGRTLPATIRMTAAVVEQFMNDKHVFDRTDPPDWHVIWERVRTGFDIRHADSDWIAVYVDSQPVYASTDTASFDALETANGSGEISNKSARRAVDGIIDGNATVDVEHDSQIALVLAVDRDVYKCSILERRANQTRSFAFKVKQISDTGRVPITTVLKAGADVIEAMNLRALMERASAHPSSTSPSVLRDALGRYRDLLQLVHGYETAYGLDWFPDKPKFLVAAPGLLAPTMPPRYAVG